MCRFSWSWEMVLFSGSQFVHIMQQIREYRELGTDFCNSSLTNIFLRFYLDFVARCFLSESSQRWSDIGERNSLGEVSIRNRFSGTVYHSLSRLYKRFVAIIVFLVKIIVTCLKSIFHQVVMI